jgi:DNA-binding LacI/PurR family transcriptional regulator
MISAEFSTPPLTTIEQPFNDMGRVAVNALLSFINERVKNGSEGAEQSTPLMSPETDAAVPATTGCVKLLPTRLIERASTAPPRK